MRDREEYVRKMHAKLNELNAEIDLLAAKAGEVAAGVQQEFREQIGLLKVKQAAVRHKLGELNDSRGNAWHDMKSGIDLAWNAIREALDSARSRFK